MLKYLAACALMLPSMQPVADDPPDCGLELHIAPDDLDLANERGALTAVLANAGPRALRLVLPGDGSLDGWRTPRIEWQFTPTVDQVRLRCGNVNALRAGEVFTLQPGESRVLADWVTPDVMGEEYRARMVYANEPALAWHGLPLGRHDEAEMIRVGRTDRCRAVSNEITVRGQQPAGER
ncbi:MAG TPA: hypothetical protein VFQ51_06070 [Vicinamibacteria bacterium]|nr:hypothetical protein [Vicinamibacteria bacterium]